MDEVQDPGGEDIMQHGEVMEPTTDDDYDNEKEEGEEHEEEEDTSL